MDWDQSSSKFQQPNYEWFASLVSLWFRKDLVKWITQISLHLLYLVSCLVGSSIWCVVGRDWENGIQRSSHISQIVHVLRKLPQNQPSEAILHKMHVFHFWDPSSSSRDLCQKFVVRFWSSFGNTYGWELIESTWEHIRH